STGQLSQCNSSSPSAATLGGPAPYWQSFTYNLLGDRTQQVKHDTTGNALKNTVQTSAYPGGGTAQAARPNTATSITTTGPSGTTTLTPHYDIAGNTTSRDTQTGTAAATTQTLTYNTEGRTDTVTSPKTGGGTQTSNYLYDADGGLLLQKGADTNVLYLFGGAEQLTLTKATNKVAGLRYYTNPDGTRLTRSSAGTLTYQPTNPQKTAQLQVDASTLTVTRRAYDPYGAPRGTTPANWIDNHGYLGKPADAASGLDLLGARNYDPALGRFLSVDPVLEAGDPNQMGGYTYAGDDPVNSSDPSGLWSWPSWSDVGDFFTGVGDSAVGTPWEWGVNGLGYFGNSISSIWNGENELFNEWTGWDGPPGLLGMELPHNSWESDGHPLADLFGVDTKSTSYVAGEVTGTVAQVAADGYGVYKLAKEYKATKAAVAAGAEVGEAGGTASRMLRDDPDAGTPPAKPDAGKPADGGKPSDPGTGTPKTSPKAQEEAPAAASEPTGPTSRGEVGKRPSYVDKEEAPTGWTAAGQAARGNELARNAAITQRSARTASRSYVSGYHVETGELAVASSGPGITACEASFCAEGNVVQALGGDWQKVRFGTAYVAERVGDGFEATGKYVCPRCQGDYPPSSFSPGTAGSPEGQWFDR
ncbi:RHS repeat-associated core domain-containing protein, partial [Streptomyces sp. NPDC020719]|uniref:RHS repeat-associated core domain-containing protein n=1 Tax=Streptomyces sp. NPDC020719 TaxID=3154896 RepID=UPI0033F918DD